jgi:hypothetical protein
MIQLSGKAIGSEAHETSIVIGIIHESNHQA